MKTYSQFRPTGFDIRGAFLTEQQDWLVAPVSQTRDSEPLTQSNFACFLDGLGGKSDTVDVHRFGHWGPGWFELILISPNDSQAIKRAEDMEASLENYPILNETDCSEREMEEANQVWQNCFCNSERIDYIRKNRNQFEFRSFEDMLSCARGNYFAEYASELIS